MAHSILLVEDDESLHRGIQFTLQQEGYATISAHTVNEARAEMQSGAAFDLILLDVQLPDGNGFDFCTEIRRHSRVPIIFLTASDQEIDVVRGLDLGGDDYITKPFRLREFLSRIQAVLRRQAPPSTNTGSEPLHAGGISLYAEEMRAQKNGRDVLLSLTEFRLLALFLAHPRAVLSKDQLIRHVWPDGVDILDDNTVAVNIRRLREKIEDDPQHPQLIQTVRGAGYRWNG